MVIGALNFYDESPLWLSAAVQGAAKLCDHIIAVDGAYALYPGGKPRSTPESSEAIVEAANAAGVGLTLHWPAETWVGNQVEKRNFMFKLAHQVGQTWEDWVYVFDADDLVTEVPVDTHQKLRDTEHHVAVYTLWWTEDMNSTPKREAAAAAFPYPDKGSNRYFRSLFRLIPNLRCEDAHYHYLGEVDGETIHLRGHPNPDKLATFLDLTSMKVQHRHPQRTLKRLETSAAYDKLMREFGIEVDPNNWVVA